MILSGHTYNYWLNSGKYYSMTSIEQFLEYFFYGIEFNKINGVICDIQDLECFKEYKNTNNILICVENCPRWTHYSHYNEYGDYGNNDINIYFYNHINKCVFKEKYIAVPVIYLRITYFKHKYEYIRPSYILPFSKKFCLITTVINSPEKKQIVDMLKDIGDCDHIQDYKQYILNKSCYNSQELLDVFQLYKFVFVCENSVSDGYVTEKIFNGFFSRVVPIYYGAKDIYRYFNKSCFVNIEDDLQASKQQIQLLNENYDLYKEMLASPILNTEFDDENYIIKVNKFIKVNEFINNI